jgi:uncharacterized paraquat-inducible protein A
LLFKGYLTEPQLKDLLSQQHKRVMACPACRLSFSVVTLSDGKSVSCPRCRGPLEGVPGGHATRTDAEFSTRKIPIKPSAGGPLARFTCVVCEQSFQATREASGRVRCPACQSSFVPK